MTWSVHHEEDCSVCMYYRTRRKGGAPKKVTKGRGRPNNKLAAPRTQIILTKNWFPTNLSKSLFPKTNMPFLERVIKVNEMTICPICKEVLDTPVFTNCEHAYCHECLSTWAKHCCQNGGSIICPECHTYLNPASIRPPPRLLLQLIANLTATCNKCNNIYQLDALETHELACSRAFVPTTPSISQSQNNVSHLLQKANSEPLNHTEERLATKLIKRKLAAVDGGTISLVTGGKQLHMTVLPCGRVSAELMSQRTKLRRVQQMNQARGAISGGNNKILLTAELHHIAKSERQAIMKEAGFKLEVPQGD